MGRELTQTFETSESVPSLMPSCNPSQTVLPTGNQTFKLINLWVLLSLKSPQPVSVGAFFYHLILSAVKVLALTVFCLFCHVLIF